MTVSDTLTEELKRHRPSMLRVYPGKCRCGSEYTDWDAHITDAVLAIPDVAVVQLDQPVDHPDVDVAVWDQVARVEVDKRELREPRQIGWVPIKHLMNRFGAVFGYSPDQAWVVAAELLSAARYVEESM